MDLLGGPEGLVYIKVYDHDGDGTHDLIGSVSTTVRQLTMGQPQFPIINKKKQGQLVLNNIQGFSVCCRALYRNSGTLYVKFSECNSPPIEPYHPGFVFTVHGEKLERKDNMGFGKSGLVHKIEYNSYTSLDPYFIIKSACKQTKQQR